jgi:hypothetical protein
VVRSIPDAVELLPFGLNTKAFREPQIREIYALIHPSFRVTAGYFQQE